MATRIEPASAIVVTEESAALWARRRDRIGIGDHVRLLVRPFKGRPSPRDWETFLAKLAEIVARDRVGVVVFDTISGLWGVEKENDAGQVLGALALLNRLTEAEAAVLLIHHPRKSGGEEGQASRGSGALTGFVDIIVELRRFNAADRHDRCRVLRTFSRFSESPEEVVVELTSSGYVSRGSRAEVAKVTREQIVLSLLPANPPGLTAEKILDKWPADRVPPGKRTLETILKGLVESGRAERLGSGRKGDSYKFVSRTLREGACANRMRESGNVTEEDRSGQRAEKFDSRKLSPYSCANQMRESETPPREIRPDRLAKHLGGEAEVDPVVLEIAGLPPEAFDDAPIVYIPPASDNGDDAGAPAEPESR